MNRRERRAQWVARHRNDGSVGNDAGASGILCWESVLVRGREGHYVPDQQARVESDTALHLEKQAVASLRLRIGEMVLHGFNPRERYTISDSIQQKLTRLISERGVPSLINARRSAERLDAGTFQVTPNLRPQRIGAQVAWAIYGGLR